MRKILDIMGLEGLTKEEVIDGLLASLVIGGFVAILFTIGAILEVIL